MTSIENYSRDIGLIVFLVVLAFIFLLCWLLWWKLQKCQKTGKTLPLVNSKSTLSKNEQFIPPELSIIVSSQKMEFTTHSTAPTHRSLYSDLSYINAPDLEFLYTDINEHTIVRSTLFSKKEEKPVRKFQKEDIRISNAKEIMANSSKFEKIRAECISKGLLFEDPDFSPKDALPNASSDIKWLRPHEIVSNPEFFTDGQSRFDVVQGAIADCWLLAAVATISMCDGLFFRVVPPDQGFSKKEGYAGVFYFHFWRYGEWVEVVVDDRLPTYNNSLIFMHSKDGNEFWSALLEKAYAKIYGSYNAIQLGYTSEAIQDMSGGLTECFELDNPPPNLLEMIIRGLNKNSIFGCSYNKEIPSKVIECSEEEIKEVPLKLCEGPLEDTKEESISTEDNKRESRPGNDVKEESRPVGNIKEESRPMENVEEASRPVENVKEESGPVEKVKEESIPTENAKEESNEVTICHTESVRTDGIVMQHAYSINGVCKIKTKEKTVALLRLRNPWGKMEWNQAWSDGSKEWDLVSPEVREKIKLSFDEDGEFWMEFGDFMAKFCYMDVCHLDPLLITDVSFESTNSQVNWMMSTYHGTLKQQSPDDKEFQDEYRFKLDDLVPGEDLTIVIAVMQKYRRENSLAMMGLAFAVCEVGSETSLNTIKPLPWREGTCSLKVSPGEYSIVSVAYSEIDFMIRVYTNGFICSEQGSVSEVESRDKIFC